MIEIEVTEEHAELLVKQMENELKRINNTLNSFRSNDLTHTESYRKLQAERDGLESGIRSIQGQINEQSTDEIAELFG